MGSSKKSVVGYKFYAGAGLAFVKYASKILRIKIGDKLAWSGSSSGGVININKELLFGTKTEGGVVGAFSFQRGEPTQMPDAYLTQQLGEQISANRGVSQLILRQPYMGNSPYLKDIEIRAERVFELDGGDAQWYPEKAGIIALDSAALPIDSPDWDTQLLPYESNPGFNNLTVPAEGWIAGGQGPFDDDNRWLRTPNDLSVFWIRKTVTVGDANVSGLVLKAAADNGCCLFINGSFVGASNQANVDIPSNSDFPVEYTVSPGTTYEIAVKAFTESLSSDQAGNYLSVRIDGEPIWDCNPANMIREALTNKEWGYGYDEADIDDASFTAVADQLYNESFGLSYHWKDDGTLDTVINKILDHIDGVLYLDRTTLKLTIDLVRNDYDPDTLPEFRAGFEVVGIENYKKPQFTELVNTITLEYYDISNGGNGSLTQSNSALLLQQGKRITKQVDYSMCCNRGLASRLLQREFDLASRPFSSCDVTTFASAAQNLRRGSAFKLTHPDFAFNQTIMRVTEISRGNGTTKATKIACVEDRFAMPSDSIIVISPPVVPPSNSPVPLANRLLIEEPYALLVGSQGQSKVDQMLAEAPDAGLYAVAAARTGNALSADIYVDNGSGYENVDTLNFCPFGALTSAIDYLTSSFSLTGFEDLDELEGSRIFQVDNEIMAYTSIDVATGAMTGVLRGLFDTIPAKHSAGAKAFFIEFWLDGDETQYADGETINVKLLPTFGSGQLDLSAAPADALAIVGRAARPYAPGLFKVGGTAYPATASGAFAVTWAHRDRQAQADQIVDTLQPSLTLPQNQRYGLRFSQANDGTLLVERLDIGAATATVTLNYTGDVKCELWAIDDNGDSFQKHELTFGYTPPSGTPTNTITATAYTPYVPTWEIDGNGS